MMRSFLVLILIVAAAVSAYGQETVRAVVGGTLVTPNLARPLENSTIIIRGGRIVRVGSAQEVPVPQGAEVVDARGKWVIPGLVDAHVHFHQSGGLYTRPDTIDLRKVVRYEKERSETRKNLDDTFARYLRSGITSVVDVGGPFWNFEIRERSKKIDLAPRVAVAGPLISTVKPPALSEGDDPQIIKADTPRQARALVQRQAAKKPDMIKIWLILSPGEKPQKYLPIIRSVIDESHRHKLRVAVHATELETARLAVNAGADILVHSVEDREVDEDFIQLVKKKRVPLVTTLIVQGNYARTFSQQLDFVPAEFEMANPLILSSLFDLRHIALNDLPSRIGSLINAPRPVPPPTVAMKNLKKLVDAGVRVAAGTDAGNIGTLPGPSIFRELKMMAESGLTPMQVLTAATADGALVMGREKELGTVEEGKLADMVVLNSDPLLDIGNTSDIHLVIKDGKSFRPGEIIRKRPEDVVQQQINAFNARAIHPYMATFSPDVKIFEQPDRLLSTGREALRKEYERLFSTAPKLHARVTGRMVSGCFVAVAWVTTGLPGGKEKSFAALYEVRDDLIQRMWLLPAGGGR